MAKAKILLIEDDPVQSEFISRQLKSSGYEVLVAARANEGIELAKKGNPALIILDMILPGMHGLEAAMKLLDMPETKNIPIVALSGMTIPKFVEECYRIGIKDFLKKPCDPKHLLKVVEKFAGKQKREGTVAVVSKVSAAYTQLVMYLGKMHLKVETILPTRKNLEKLMEIKPNVIFIEISPQEKNKKDFIKRIKQDEKLRGVPVLIFSPEISEEKMPDLVNELGADGYLAYPFEYFSLMEAIDQYLKSNE
ncbi:MAG: response regulator [Candidatus Aminicenantes bacterium]|nr:response regulator [Candidatus Aminicenantes bacterium]